MHADLNINPGYVYDADGSRGAFKAAQESWYVIRSAKAIEIASGCTNFQLMCHCTSNLWVVLGL